MSILDDISKMIQDSDEFSDSEKKSLMAMCKDSYDMEMEAKE
jgi:hypothetical protein